MAKCPTCDGTGDCPVCGGEGELRINPHPSPAFEKTDGSGTSKCYLCMGKRYCPDCKGTGAR